MKGYLILTCSVAAVLAGYVHSKPHGGVTKPNHHPQQPDPVKLLATKTGETLPTFLPTESSTPEDEETSEDEESRVQFQQVDSDGLQQDSPEDNRATDEKETGLESEEDEESVTESEDEADNGEEEDGKEAYTSTESEIPVDLDYLSDGDSAQPQPITKQNAGTPKALENHTTEDNVIPRVMADYDGQQSNTDSDEAEESAEPTLPKEPIQENTPEEVPSVDEENHQQEVTNRLESETLIRVKKSRNKKQRKQESDDQGRGKDRKHRKMQSDQASAAEATQRENLPTGSKAKEAQLPENIETKGRKKNGKWNRMVGMNPVQIRATMELYPDTRAAHRTGGLELPADPCVNFRCKRGKTCTLNDENKPTCVCQDPSTCLPSVNGFDHVCGTDNKTYDTSCQLFATKCGLEGTKKGHRLHLDYTGSCKFIAPCLEAELVQFPLRMRDWLKNVLLQLNEHDSVSPGFLTAKQKIKVQKIFESERRLHQGNHPVELLLQDFEKNYNMYIYPVHWQFAQMDQHPSDRFLSHSELAPLRVPLVPMEHCTSVFFQKCDSDKDKLVSFEEWCSCFGIKEDDMDTNLLF